MRVACRLSLTGLLVFSWLCFGFRRAFTLWCLHFVHLAVLDLLDLCILQMPLQHRAPAPLALWPAPLERFGLCGSHG